MSAFKSASTDPQQEKLVGAYAPGSFRAERLNLDNGVTTMVIDPAVTPDNRLTFGLSNKELVKCFGTERLEFRPTGLGTGVIYPRQPADYTPVSHAGRGNGALGSLYSYYSLIDYDVKK